MEQLLKIRNRHAPSFKVAICDLKAGRGGHRKYLPFVFTEQGVAMLSSVLKNDRAIEVNVAIMRAFVQLRKPSALNHDLFHNVKQLDEKIDRIEQEYDAQFGLILEKMQQMMDRFSFRALPAPAHIESSAKASFEEGPKEVSTNGVGNVFIDNAGSAKVGAIVREVADYFGLKPTDLKASGRTRAVVLPRQLTMYLIRKHVGIGYKEIGRYFGGQDHTIYGF